MEELAHNDKSVEFEKWYLSVGNRLLSDPTINYWDQIVRAAFLAGMEAHRNKDVEIATLEAFCYGLDTPEQNVARDIAKAIEEG